MARKQLIEHRLSGLISNFGRYVRAYDDRVPFTGEQLTAHQQTIELRWQAGSVRAAIEDKRYLACLRQTLLAWGVGRRASRLVAEEEFAAALRAAVPCLEALERLRIDSPELPGDIAHQLWSIIESLGVVTNKAKLVAGTKTLHHLLPDLVVPMDRAWTGTFFNFHLPEWQDPASQRRILQLAYEQFTAVARRANLEQYVTHQGWRTSRTKIIDNALIGFCKVELGTQPLPVADARNEISFDVLEYPPSKDGADSIFAAAHGHAPRIRRLLDAARQALAEQHFLPIEDGYVAVEVVLHAPKGGARSDATNYLGGIGDVLEDKTSRGLLDHLDDLGAIWLYRNDRQIKEVTYREVESDEPGYTITVRQLGS